MPDHSQQCQFLVVTGDAPAFTPDRELLRLTQGIGLAGDAVFTAHDERILAGLAALLEEMNYKPNDERLRLLVRRLQEIGGEGLFATISDKAPSGFSASALRGQLGLAVTLDWLAEETAAARSHSAWTAIWRTIGSIGGGKGSAPTSW